MRIPNIPAAPPSFILRTNNPASASVIGRRSTPLTSRYITPSIPRSLQSQSFNFSNLSRATTTTTSRITPPTPLSYNTTKLRAISLSTLPFIGHFFSSTSSNMSDESFPVQKSDNEWRAVLSREQFRILREKGTEAPYSGEYDKSFQSGTYNCAACDYPLYKSTTKFKSGCGWPAFYEGIPGHIKSNTDTSFGLARTEIVCGNCGGHLGHVFKNEGYNTPTNERHCVNSVSLKLEKEV